MMSETVYVYDDFSQKNACLMGYLYIDKSKGKESYAFEYDDTWLKSHINIYLDPHIIPYSGRQYPQGMSIFGVFADASPDRWGRTLLMKKERLLADSENRKPRKLLDSDYLLGVYDEVRMGGLRFKTRLDGDYVSSDHDEPVPPWTTLRKLEEATRKNDDVLDEKWLNQLLRPGSSLGGARPKATVVDPKGELWIAKFPSKNDEVNIGAWEKVSSDLARLCKLDVPESKLESFSRLGSTFIVKRFDRKNSRRVHFASAMTLLGKTDGSIDDTSYLDMASFIKAHGSSPKEDLVELFKRIVFSMATSNTDDHLRNHAFILEENGWKLSPLYDVNPVPYGDELSLSISETDSKISFELAISTAHSYGISQMQAQEVVADIRKIVKSRWEKLATKYGVKRAEIEYMRPAFSECYK